MQEEEIKEINRTISELTAKFEDKFDELSKSIGKTVGEEQEYAQGKISEKPLAYSGRSIRGRGDRGLRTRQGKIISKIIRKILFSVNKSYQARSGIYVFI